jgi:hypothetical protein
MCFPMLMNGIFEVNQNTCATDRTEFVRFSLSPKSVFGHYVLARQELYIFSLWVDEEVAIFGANRTVTVDWPGGLPRDIFD